MGVPGSGLLARVRTRVEEVRRRRPVVDHLVLVQEHHGRVEALHAAAFARTAPECARRVTAPPAPVQGPPSPPDPVLLDSSGRN